MIVLNNIADDLWQAGARHPAAAYPGVNVILTALTAAQLPATLLRDFVGTIEVIPFPDATHHDLDELAWVSMNTAAERYKGDCVLTVCAEGKNRSGLLSALVLYYRGWDVETAIGQVKCRGSAPGSVEALSNSVFLKRLRSM